MEKILVVEDDHDLRKNICEILEAEEYKVYSATNGEEGFNNAKVFLPDLIISDVMMPKIDGFKLIKLLSEENSTSTIPVILLTAKVELEDVRQGMNLGADDYLFKPFLIDELLNSVQTRLKKKNNLESKFDELKINLSEKIPHELRTPLVPIIGFSEMIEAENDLGSVKEMARMISKSGNVLKNKIEKFLLYKDLILLGKNRMINTHNTFIDEVMMYNAINKIDTNLRAKERVKIIKLEKGTVKISPKFVESMFTEIVENALKFSTEDKFVEINGLNESGQYVFSVKDFGRGMFEHEIESINSFQKFGKEAFRQRGFGLGLEIVKKISTIHNCNFKLTSEIGKYTIAELRFVV